MGPMASPITSLAVVYSTVYSGADQRKHHSSASLAFVRGIHRWPVNSPQKGPIMRKMFQLDDVIMKTYLSQKLLQQTVNWKCHIPAAQRLKHSVYIRRVVDSSHTRGVSFSTSWNLVCFKNTVEMGAVGISWVKLYEQKTDKAVVRPCYICISLRVGTLLLWW